MKPLSEQLADLSAHAKRAEDDAAAARTEAHTKIQARVDKLQADAAARAARMDAATVPAKDTVAGRWAALQAQVRANIDGMKADMAATKTMSEAGRTDFRAMAAEDNASAAIAFALDAIDYAELAVLDAIVARADADTAAAVTARPDADAADPSP